MDKRIDPLKKLLRSFKIYILTQYLSHTTCPVGDLIDRHMKVFSNNKFFEGLTIPTPSAMEPLTEKFPNADEQALSFMTVRREY